MTLGLSDDDRDIRDSVRGWAARHATPEVIREAVEAKSEARPSYWSSFAELGMLGLHLPEEFGGADCGLLETAIVAEELGRAMCPGRSCRPWWYPQSFMRPGEPRRSPAWPTARCSVA